MPGVFNSISSFTVTSPNTTTVTFNSIPTTYKDLHIRGVCRINTRSDITGWYAMGLVINNDIANSGQKYSWQRMLSYNGSTIAGSYESWTNPDRFYWPYAPTDKNPSAQYGFFTIDILNYNSASARKSVKSWAISSDSSAANSYTIYVNGVYVGTSAVTRLDFTTIGGTDSIAQGTTFDLYGVG
jgi:hypothetical protein